MKTDAKPFSCETWLTPWRFSALLFVLVLASFPDVLLAGNSFVVRDFGGFGYPLAYYHRQSFWRGEVPLWNPLNNCGLPFLAQWNTLVLYPLSSIYLFLPIPWSVSVFCLVHLFIAGLGMYFLARHWTGNALAASIAGLMYAFNGLTLNALMWPNNMAGLGWAPWVLLLVDVACARGGRKLLLAAFIGALQMLSGAPEIIFCTWCFATVFFLFGIFCDKEKQLPRFLRFVGVVVLISCLAAAQLLPFFDLSIHGERDYEVVHRGIPSWGVLNLFVPLFRCMSVPQGYFMQPTQYWTSSYYLGVGGLALFVAGCRWIRDRRLWVLLAVCVLSFFVAMAENTPFYFWLCKLLPHFDEVHFPVKAIVLAVFALPLLAAMSVAELRALPAEKFKSIANAALATGIAFLLVIAGILFFSHEHPMLGEKWDDVWQSGKTRGAVLVFILGIFLLLFKSNATVSQQLLVGAFLLTLIWLDLFTHAPRQNPTVKPFIFEPGIVAETFHPRPQPGISRVTMSRRAGEILYQMSLPIASEDYVHKRFGVFANCNLLDDIPKTGGFYSTYLPGQLRVLKDLFFFSDESFPERLADFLSVSHLSSSHDPMHWNFRPTHLPMATIGQKPLFIDGAAMRSLLLSKEFDPRQVVCLPPAQRETIQATNDPTAKIIRSHFDAHHIEIEAEAGRATLLVLSQSFYHDWKAAIDGAPVEILNANGGFQALPIPAGRHSVKFIYEDKAFVTGAVISIVTLLACLVGCWRWKHCEK